MESLKNGTNEPIYKSEIVTDVENKLMVTKEKGGKDKLGGWDWHRLRNLPQIYGVIEILWLSLKNTQERLSYTGVYQARVFTDGYDV